MRKEIGILSLCTLILAAICTITVFSISNKLNKDTRAWIEAAQAAKDPGEIISCLKNAKNGMIKWGFTGKASMKIYEDIDNKIYLAQKIDVQNFDPDSPQYALMLVGLKSEVNKIDITFYPYYFTHIDGMFVIIQVISATIGLGMLLIWIILDLDALVKSDTYVKKDE